jgi:hypothetical protein
MTWATLVPLIIQYGLPVAESIWKKVTSGTVPSQSDWDELKALASETARDRALAAMARATPPIDPSSPQGIAILAAVG